MASNTDAPGTPNPAPDLAPVSERARIESLDAVRGFALLGIFLVNIQSFAEPLGLFIDHYPPDGSTAFESALFFAVKAVAEGKFYPLFSILFGMGLILQFGRAEGAKRAFVPMYLRRLIVLALFGLAHALLLWYGDILFLYALVGVPLLLMRSLHPKAMLVVSIALITVSTLLWTGFATLGVAMQQNVETPAHLAQPAPETTTPANEQMEPAPEEPALPQAIDESLPSNDTAGASTPEPRTALDILSRGFETGEVFDPTSDLRNEASTVAYRDGPYLHAVIMRTLDWSTFMMVAVIAMGWHVAAMFLLGAALMKWNIFHESRRPLRRTLAIVGLAFALPVSAFAALAPALLGGPGVLVQALLIFPVGPIVALGYLSAISLLADAGRARPLIRALANAGRMALTVYLLETIVSSAIFQHWGLALFGEVPRLQRIALVFLIYGGLVAFTTLWLKAFVMGPFEWLWRSLTYLRLQPLLRRSPRV